MAASCGLEINKYISYMQRSNILQYFPYSLSTMIASKNSIIRINKARITRAKLCS